MISGWALQIQRLEGSRCGGGRLCNLNAPMNAGDRGIVSVWLLIGAVRALMMDRGRTLQG